MTVIQCLCDDGQERSGDRSLGFPLQPLFSGVVSQMAHRIPETPANRKQPTSPHRVNSFSSPPLLSAAVLFRQPKAAAGKVSPPKAKEMLCCLCVCL